MTDKINRENVLEFVYVMNNLTVNVEAGFSIATWIGVPNTGARFPFREYSRRTALTTSRGVESVPAEQVVIDVVEVYGFPEAEVTRLVNMALTANGWATLPVEEPEEEKPMDIVTAVMIADGGEPCDDQDRIIEAYQMLIDTGTIGHLQGSLQRTAAALLEQGFCTLPIS